MKEDALLPTRQSLIQRLKDWQDQASWQDFFNTYWKLIYGTATKAGLTDAEAQDVVQETVLTVAKKIHEFQVDHERGSFKAWLLNTTRWRITDQFRKRCRAQQADHPGDESSRTATVERVPDPASLTLDEFWEKDWQQNLLNAAVEKAKQQVDADSFQMFSLHVLKQWPAQKVAKFLGVSMGQVYFAKYKIARKIKKEVQRLEHRVI